MGQKINLKAQVKHYKLYWKITKRPEEDIYPKGVEGDMAFGMTQIYKSGRNGKLSCVFIQTNEDIEKVWIYDRNYGWKQLTIEESEEVIFSEPDQVEKILKKFFGK